MFSKTTSIYSIINFNKEDYSQIIKNIESSRGYISYIDSKLKKGVTNPRYEKYLDLKQALYTFRPPVLPSNKTNLIAHQLPDGLTKKKLDNLNVKYGVQDDYYIDYKLINDQHGVKVYNYKAIPIECEIFNDSLRLDENFQKLNQSCLSDTFIMNNNRRFMMLPFLIKLEDKYVEPVVIVNVYDVGIITIQLIIYVEHDNVIQLTEAPPRFEKFPEVYFYKILQNYKVDDFWEKEVKYNLNSDEIIEFYEKQLSTISKTKLKSNQNNRSMSWVFGDFELDKDADHRDFITKHKKLYASHLTNGNKDVIERKTNEDIDELLKVSEIDKNGQFAYFSSPTSSVVSVGYSAFLEKAKETLKDTAEELKKEGRYSDHLNQIFRVQTFNLIIQYYRFYELTFIKRYFLKELLTGISSGNYKTIKDYNAVKKELNFIKLQYDEEVLFFTEGSPKELYKSILEKTNVNKLLAKAEELVKSISEDTSIIRETRIKRNETLILILTSIMTILLGYTGIKLIVNDVLLNLPIMGEFFMRHPLRYTVGIWFGLILVMVGLNFRRWLINR
ncbi:hypothetical protein AM232_07750 [Bacillus sp. FJAT-21352]|nr:hypothetical protein AM232_07750 [Bacillus sp. FJAT-21352]